MISLTAEYALRAVAWLAGNAGQPLTTRQIARHTQVPAGYLSKVLQALVRAGLVRSQRGLGGGFSLNRRPAQITVLDVVRASDPPRRIERCPLGIDHVTVLCPLHRRLDAIMDLVEKAYRETTIAELLEDAIGNRPLCSAGTVSIDC